jgi:hypothetical protein
MSVFERTVTLIGNIISIITFVLGICGWAGYHVWIDGAIPSKRAAVAMLFAYSFLASYGQAKFLLHLALQERDVLMAWALSTFSYALGFLFLVDKCSAALTWTTEQEKNAIIGGWFANVMLFGWIYTLRQMYPEGFSMGAWLTAAFRKEMWKSSLGLCVHMFSLEVLMLAMQGKTK